MKRRTVITGAVALPVAGMASTPPAATANATDAAWSAYEAARSRYAENHQAYDAFEATIPIGPRPRFGDFEDRDEWERLRDARGQERAGYPDNPFALDDDALDALCAPMHAAEDAILSAKAATLTDIERKLAVISNWGGDHLIEADRVDGILADVRVLNGSPQAGGVS